MPHVLADTRSGKGSCLKAGRDGAVRQFCLKAIDIDLAQQIKESQNSEAKATSCRFWSTRFRGQAGILVAIHQRVDRRTGKAGSSKPIQSCHHQYVTITDAGC
jgi:hypothetical protein